MGFDYCTSSVLHRSLIIEMYLMIKFARLGPSSLHTGKYHFEKQEPKATVNGEALS